MLRFALLAVAAAIIVAVGLVVLPIGGSRPDSHIAAGPAANAPDPATFVVHDAAPPAPGSGAPGAPPAAGAPGVAPSPGDLNAVMQRLRDSAAQKPGAPATPNRLDVTAPAPVTPPVAAVPATPPAAPADAAPPPARWTNVTGQGSRWRMGRAGNGFTVSIDLGSGQVADVHVQSAFAALDPAAMNLRVDYLRETILQSFSSQSASYTFARDGSVSLDH